MHSWCKLRRWKSNLHIFCDSEQCWRYMISIQQQFAAFSFPFCCTNVRLPVNWVLKSCLLLPVRLWLTVPFVLIQSTVGPLTEDKRNSHRAKRYPSPNFGKFWKQKIVKPSSHLSLKLLALRFMRSVCFIRYFMNSFNFSGKRSASISGRPTPEWRFGLSPRSCPSRCDSKDCPTHGNITGQVEGRGKRGRRGVSKFFALPTSHHSIGSGLSDRSLGIGLSPSESRPQHQCPPSGRL